MKTAVRVVNESIYPDGGYSALVRIGGLEWTVSYIALRVEVRGNLPSSARPDWRFRSDADRVRSWATDRIRALGADHLAAHCRLYAEELEAAGRAALAVQS